MIFESLEQAKLFHKLNKDNWIGEAIPEHKEAIFENIKNKNVNTILDYGCGKARFHKLLFKDLKHLKITKFDPAVEEFSNKPQGLFDLILCIDVLEHIEENKLKEIIEDIFNYGNNVIFTITCYPATQILPNGKNAHYTIKEPNWWDELLKPYFGKYTVFYKTDSKRSSITINEEEWVPDSNTIERYLKNPNDKRIDKNQIEKIKKYLNINPRS